MREHERGSVAPFLALLVVAVGGLCTGLGRLGALANASARTQTAADAAALAAAADGEQAARELLQANGAALVRLDHDGAEYQVVAQVGGAQAVARAVGPAESPGRSTPGASTDGLVAAMRSALGEAARLLGEPVPITSGWRSHAAQQWLYDDRGTNHYPVAEPGRSMHERGRAVDVPRSFVARLASVATRAGLCHPWPETDPVHFELCGNDE